MGQNYTPNTSLPAPLPVDDGLAQERFKPAGQCTTVFHLKILVGVLFQRSIPGTFNTRGTSNDSLRDKGRDKAFKLVRETNVLK